MKRVFLMDYENTAVRGLYGISELGIGDKVVVFCSNENIQRALIDLLKVYEERRVEIRVHLLKKRAINALDFMITTYLGFEVSMDDEKEIFVISADKGYESAIDMAHELSNGIFIGFHESIYDCIHEKYAKALPEKHGKEVITIEAEETMAISGETKKSLHGEEYKAISGPVADVVENAPTGRKKGFSPLFGLGGKKRPATNRQRDAYRKRFMERVSREGRIPEQYVNQLTAFMDKCHDSEEFKERATVALGNKNKAYVDVAVAYFEEYDMNRP
ncbi:MAG: hypothetical protein K6F92_10635 [Lachnospiraceae bacterium]|nr:hypothetical protein [Lachnospiraceae bacterium]